MKVYLTRNVFGVWTPHVKDTESMQVAMQRPMPSVSPRVRIRESSRLNRG